MSDEIERLTRERDELRRICIAAINATDGACSDNVSTEFLALLPREIEMMKGRLETDRDEALALVEVMREALGEMVRIYGDMEDGDGETPGEITHAHTALAATGPASLAEVRARAWE